MNCPRCGVPNEPGAKTCEVCGASLPPSCKGCGRKVPEGVEYCVLCLTGRTEEIAQQRPVGTPLEVPAGFLPKGLDFEVPFVGRGDDLERLDMLFKSTVEGQCLTFVTLTGPPGVGKTRLAIEATTRFQKHVPDALVVRGVCGGAGAPPYAAFIHVVAALAGIHRKDKPPVARTKLSDAVAAVLPENRAPEVTHLLAHMLQIPFPASTIVEPGTSSAARLEIRIFMAVRRFLEALARRSPLLLFLDNAERAGPETVNLIHYLAAGIRSAPVALLVVGRPEMLKLHPQWGIGEFEYAKFELGPLSPDESEELLHGILKGLEPLPPALTHTVRNRLERNPRAVQELVRYLLEVRILEREDGKWTLHEDLLSAIEIPDSHEEIVRERLRSLDPAELEVLEKASIAGETFWLDLVVALYRAVTLERGDPDGPPLSEIAESGDRNQASVAQALQRHVTRGFIVERGSTQIRGEREYRFSYPPIRRLVYERIDQDRKRKLHKLAAQWLELRPEGRSGSHQEEVGKHLERAGERAAAAQRFRRAADVARAAYSNDRAIQLYRKALECVGESDVAMRIHLWHDLGSVHELKGEFDEALAAYERMLRLAWVMASKSKGGVAFNKMGRIWRQKGQLDLALDYLTKGKNLFEQAGDERGVAGSLDDIGQVLWMQGKYEEALQQSAAALEKRRRLGNLRSIAASLTNVGNIEKDRGLLNEAAACHEEALAIRREIGDRAGIVVSLHCLGHLEFLRGNETKARQLWQEALAGAEDIGAAPMQALILTWLGQVALEAGNHTEARQRFDEALKLCREFDDRRVMAEAMRGLAEAEATEEGDLKRALGLAEEAVSLAEQGGFKDTLGRAYLALARVHARTLFDASGEDPGTKAKAAYEKALDLFREIGNDAELARALADYGEFAAEREDWDLARRLLADAKDRMARLGMRRWRDAAALLDTLGGDTEEG